jgi:uncharacterized protein YbjT (DUF2867 family)
MKEKILVTGASGVIGREIVRTIIERGNCVRIGMRDVRKAVDMECGICPVIPFDYERPDTFKEAFDGITGFFLATPATHPRIDELVLPAILHARQSGVRHIVSLGSIGVDIDPESPLLVIERCIQSCGIDYTILRPNILMQNLATFAGSGIKDSGMIRAPLANATVSFVDARDVAAAVAETLISNQHRNRMYVLTGSETLDFRRVASILTEVTGKQISYQTVTHDQARADLIDAGWSGEIAELMIGLYEIARQGWCSAVRPDLRDILGRAPITFEQFARDYIKSWM